MLDLSQSLTLLAACNPHLERARTEFADDWRPDEPPPTFAMSAMAKAFVSAASELPVSDIEAVSACVERILETGTEDAKNAVATGFLEALLTAGDLEKPGAELTLASLGPLARAYCEEWNKFTGVEKP